MTEFYSSLLQLVENFVAFRKASERWNASYDYQLHRFFRDMMLLYPCANELTQEMVDAWCSIKGKEIPGSCRKRSYAIVMFVRYLKERGQTAIVPPTLPPDTPTGFIPHAFTHAELQRFFDASDSIEGSRTQDQRVRKITIPVFFRLLYSSGMRTTELRYLRVQDVNLDNGVIDIKISKGYDEHIVVLHDSMLDLMRKYDAAISKIIPNRTYFFPARKNGAHTECWIWKNFRELWDGVNSSYARAYDLRHNYATENINRWIGQGMNVEQKKVYLSKSMGHRVFESTEGYYHLVPALAKQLHQVSNASFEELIPDLPNENQETE